MPTKITVDRQLMSVAVEGLESTIYTAIHRLSVDRMELIKDAAVKRWPVGRTWIGTTRQHSRDLFFVYDGSNGTDMVMVSIANMGMDANGASYAFYIRTWQGGFGGKNAWVQAIAKPIRATIKVLSAEIVDRLRG